MTPDLNMFYRQMFDFVPFSLSGLTLVMKFRFTLEISILKVV